MAGSPTLSGQHIGEAEHAIRAVLDRLLVEAGTTFHQWVALRALTLGGGERDHAALAQQMTDGLKISVTAALAAIDALADDAFVSITEDRGQFGAVTLTAAGRARYEQIQDGVDQVAARLYGDLPVEDLATTRRVLALVTERANAVLAG